MDAKGFLALPHDDFALVRHAGAGPGADLGVEGLLAPLVATVFVDMDDDALGLELHHHLAVRRAPVVADAFIQQPATVEGAAVGRAGVVDPAALADLAVLAPLLRRFFQLEYRHQLAAHRAVLARAAGYECGNIFR